MPNRIARQAGLTLIEVMTVIFVIGILASIAAINFGDSIRRTSEKATQADLNNIRKALSVYASENTESLPAELTELTTGGRYLRKIPRAHPAPHHQGLSIVLAGAASDDAGGWVYTGSAANAVFVNCTHTDTKGTVWTAY